MRETGAGRGAGLVVVGSGPAGLAAVRSFRERDPVTSVIMVTADWHPPYARPPCSSTTTSGPSRHTSTNALRRLPWGRPSSVGGCDGAIA